MLRAKKQTKKPASTTAGVAAHPGGPAGSVTAEDFVSAIQKSLSIAETVRKTVTAHVGLRMAKFNSYAHAARQAFRPFLPTKYSPTVRGTTYLAVGENLSKKQETIMKEDVARAKRPISARGLQLTLSESEAQGLGVQSGVLSGILPLEKLLRHLDEGLGIGRPVAFPAIDLRCRSEVKADQTLADLAAPSTEPSPALPPTSPAGGSEVRGGPDGTTAELVAAKVALQLDQVTAPENPVTFGVAPRATQLDASEGVKLFELRAGPADVTGYHDFHNLQIAFRDVWTEVFDAQLRTKGEELYKQLVRLKEEVGASSGIEEVTSIEEYRQLMEDIRSISNQLADADDRLASVKVLVPEITTEIWARLDDATQGALYSLAGDYMNQIGWTWGAGIFTVGVGATDSSKGETLRQTARQMIQAAGEGTHKVSRVEKLLFDLDTRLAEKFSFDVFAPGSVNFGILVTYRQQWKPLNYQVGQLVSTIPLAPKEARKYTKKVVIKKTRATKEIENALRLRKEESAETARADAEIVRSATNKTNFKQNAEGGVNFAVWNAGGSHGMETDAVKQSSQVKKEFESVLKASEEYRQEHQLNVEATTTEESEEVTTGEISNPNDEIPVTYLFYELQRTYEISERIHELTPVIFVANDVPRPDEIDEEWLLTHDWILRRVILDDTFLSALDYLSKGFVGDELAAQVLGESLMTQLRVVEKVAQQVALGATALSTAQSDLAAAIDTYAKSQTKSSGGLLSAIGGFLFGSGTDTTETLRIRMDAAREAFERAERQEAELRTRLATETTALQAAAETYTKALRDQFNRRTEVARLRAHVKDNILYYMHAIWDQEPPDQRFFRLYNVDVPEFYADAQTVPFRRTSKDKFPMLTGVPRGGRTKLELNVALAPDVKIGYRKLVEVADLDSPLGYKGNYAIFPLVKSNLITTFMMQDYVDIDEVAYLHDPDGLGDYTTDELIELARCYQRRNPEGLSDEMKKQLRDELIRRWTNPYPENDLVIVPTKSLYIEALPGKHPILEDFKLVHRAIDVKKVQAEVRHAELENVRLAARTLTGKLEDPDIEKKVVIEGKSPEVTVTPE